MGACALTGGVERAKAATVSLTGSLQFSNNNAFNFSIAYDPLDRFHAVSTFGFVASGSETSSFTDTNSHAEVKELSNPQFGTIYSFSFSNPTFAYSFLDYGDRYDLYTPVANVGYSFSGKLTYDPLADYTYVFQADKAPFNGLPQSPAMIEPVTSGPVLSTVPLPASLPLFGAGLLGGAAFARRRREITAPERLGG